MVKQNFMGHGYAISSPALESSAFFLTEPTVLSQKYSHSQQ